MPKMLETYPPLQQMCRDAHIEPEQIVATILQLTGKEITPNGVIAFLRRGTRDIDYIQAISLLTGLSQSAVSEAARPRDEK